MKKEPTQDGLTEREKMWMSEENGAVYDRILASLRSYGGVDFSEYKGSTLIRRIGRRAELNRKKSLTEYLDLVVTSEEEKEVLYRDILIGVTSFFRDGAAFVSLYEQLGRLLADGRKELRIWSVACSTGEEAYSLAILLQEYKERHQSDITFKIFATDIDKEAIAAAQMGMYKKEALEKLPEELRQKYFDTTDAFCRVREELRKDVVFACHNILKDAPFSRIDLLVCRNMFIYLKPESQKRLLLSFYKLLNADGLLFLGSSESTEGATEGFHVLDKKWKLYQKNKEYEAAALKDYSQTALQEGYYMSAKSFQSQRRTEFVRILEQALEAVLEAAVLVNDKGEMVRILKDVNRYLYFKKGQIEKNVCECLKGDLGILVSHMLSEMKQEGVDTLVEKTEPMEEFGQRCVEIRLDKLAFEAGFYYLIQFKEEEEQAPVPSVNRDELKEHRIEELERQLSESRQRLQNVIEELESRNEELHSTNEEMIVSNEELQSTNEELQSVNEELCTVNGEYQRKIEELVKANADFDNLLVNADTGALYIDKDMCIRKITPIMEKNTNLLAADIGRPIFHVNFMDGYPDFAEDLRRAMVEGRMVEREIPGKHQITWLLRIRPYVEADNTVDGVLVTLYDITKRLEAAKYQMKVINNTVPGGVARMRYDGGLLIEYANNGLYELLAYSREEFAAQFDNYYDRIIYPEDWAKLREKIEDCFRTKTMLSCEYRVCTGAGIRAWRMIQAQVLENDSKPVLQCIISDIDELKVTQKRMSSLIDNMPGGILRVLYNGKSVRVLYASDNIYAMIGYTRDEYMALKREVWEGTELTAENWGVKEKLDAAVENGTQLTNSYSLQHKDGRSIWVEMRGSVVGKDTDGVQIQYIVIDITERREAELLLAQERKKLEVLAELSADMIYEYDIPTDTMYYMGKGENILKQERVIKDYTKVVFEMNTVCQNDRKRLESFCKALRGGVPRITVNMRRLCADGKYRWFEIVGRTLFDEDGEPYRVIAKASDIDERMRAEEELRLRSEQDSLTGLYNSKTTKRLIQERIAQLGAGTKGYLLVIDVDNFKEVNDEMGHLFGDAVLCTLADELKQLFFDGITGRVGGDEFVVFVSGILKKTLEKRILALEDKLGKLYSGDKENFTISCSIGAAECTAGEELDTIFKKADGTLYYVKNHGKGAMEFFSEHQIAFNTESRHSMNNFEGAYKDKNALIHKDEDLILFAMELFDRTADTKSVLQILSNRICRHFHFDDIMHISEAGAEEVRVDFHWGGKNSNQFETGKLRRDAREWKTLLEDFDESGMSVLRQQDIAELEKSTARSMLSVKLSEKGEDTYVFFVDRNEDRDWEREKPVLKRLSEIIGSHVKQLEAERKSQEELDTLLHYDALTRLPCYSRFLTLAEDMVREMPEERFFVVYADFVNFQYVNEQYGYATGDKVLIKFAERLKEFTYGRLCCRITSNHFLVLCSGAKAEELRESFIDLCRGFCEQLKKRFENSNLTIVAGIGSIDGDDTTVSSGIDRANMARKYIRETAETNCLIFTDAMRKQAELQMEICSQMEQALKRKEFRVYLQPKMELSTGRIIGAEALVRWIKDDGTIIYPDQFIPIFEQNGFITKVDFCILEQVLELQKKAIENGARQLPISVNFSRKHQENPNFVEQVLELLKKYEVPSMLLEAEITESIFMHDLYDLSANVRKLQANGVSISIDDFGSGYSSLNVLSRVSADIIKLDKRFLAEGREESKTTGFITQIVQMLKQLGFKVIAEGVETREQMKLLRDAGCDYIQGYYFAKPMPVEQFYEFVRNYEAEDVKR